MRMALSACMLEAACTTDGILWPYSAPRVSTFAYSPPRCAQAWTLTARNGAKLSIYAYSPAGCAQAWTLTVRNGAELSTFAYSPPRCAQKQGDAVGDEPRGREPLVRCDAKQGDGGGPSRDVAEVAGVRGGGPSHCSGGTSGTADAGIATVHPYVCTLPSQLVLLSQNNPPAHLWAKRPVSTTSCAVDVRLRGGGKKHWVGEGGAKCG